MGLLSMPLGLGREPCYFEMLTKKKKETLRVTDPLCFLTADPQGGGISPQKASLCRATQGGPLPTPSCVGPHSCAEAGGRVRGILTHGGHIHVICQYPLLGVRSQPLLL